MTLNKRKRNTERKETKETKLTQFVVHSRVCTNERYSDTHKCRAGKINGASAAILSTTELQVRQGFFHYFLSIFYHNPVFDEKTDFWVISDV